MSSIAVSIAMLLIKGIPEGLLATLALHIFTRTKVDLKKYLLLSFIYIAATYTIRFLPITLGVNTLLSLFVLILCFQFAYKYQLSKVVSSVISAIVIVVMVAIAELFNMFILTMMYGKEKAEVLFNSSDGITKSISTFPATVFFAVFILIGYFIVKRIDKRKKLNGEAVKESGK